MLNRVFTTFFFLAGTIIYGCASAQAQQTSQTSQSSKAQSRWTLEKYPFASDLSEAYRYRTGEPSAQIVQFINSEQNEALRISNHERYLKALARTINESTKDPFEKVKMVYDATALLLEYDTEAAKLSFIPAQSLQEILTTRKTVCEGYADVFKKICDLLNIPCEKVTGFAQGGLLPLSPSRDLTPNHAWNIVQINNLWYTIDCTWGSSTADVLTQTQTRKYTTDWLFLNGEDFRYTHFPTDSNFQLASPKINEEQFKTLPRIEPSFFDRLQLLTPLKAVNEIESTFEIKLQKKRQENIQVLFFDFNTGVSVQNKTLLKESGNTLTVTFNTPAAGTYLGMIMYNTEGNAYRGCAYFFVQAKSANNVHYPVPLKSSAKDVEIISPLVELQADSTYDFKVKVSNKKYLLLFYNGKFTRMNSKGNGLFTQKLTIPHDVQSVVIEASDSEFGQYEGIVKYFIAH